MTSGRTRVLQNVAEGFGLPLRTVIALIVAIVTLVIGGMTAHADAINTAKSEARAIVETELKQITIQLASVKETLGEIKSELRYQRQRFDSLPPR